jgi:predicted transcriptional regulator
VGEEGRCLRRSKLETYLGILEVLERHSELKLTHIMYETNVNCCVLKKYLGFLIKQDLVEEQTGGRKRMVYSITQRGITVLKYFRELQQALPILDGDHDLTLASIRSEAPSHLTT